MSEINLKADLVNIKKDTATIAKNEEWLKLIKKDPYIGEASNVIADWIKTGRTPNMGAVIKSDNQ
ncbi:MAG: hypothetical protein IT257_11770 [Chitinophagaceae bacterium]|nr:hypothetical protein [Chitinophagaceae bacterium]